MTGNAGTRPALALLLLALGASSSCTSLVPERRGERYQLGPFTVIEHRWARGSIERFPRNELLFDGKVIANWTLAHVLAPHDDRVIVFGRYGSTVAECQPPWVERELGEEAGSGLADRPRDDCAAVFLFDANTNSKRRLVSGLYPPPPTEDYESYVWSPAADRLIVHTLFGKPVVLFIDGRREAHLEIDLGFGEADLVPRFVEWLAGGKRLLLEVWPYFDIIEPVRHHLLIVQTDELDWTYVATKSCSPDSGPCWESEDYGWGDDGQPLIHPGEDISVDEGLMARPATR